VDGTYLFSGLLPGTYVVQVDATNFATGGALTGFSSSTGMPGQIENPGISKASTKSVAVTNHGTWTNGVAQSMPVTLGPGSMSNNAIDFGFFQATSLSGKVFVDKNGNGRIDPEDTTGLAGVRIQAAGPAGVATALTDASGNYSFANLPAGSYTITEKQPSDYNSSTPGLVNMTLGDAGGTLQFGQSPIVDLRLSQTASRRLIGVGSVITLTYRIQNLGALAATGVLLSTPLPSGLHFVSADGGSYDPATHHVSIGTIAPRAGAVVTIRVKAVKAGNFRSLGTVSGIESEDVLSNNASSVPISIVPATSHAAKSVATNWMLGTAH
jgi:uncharacterized repeat protein (TIGR01451 family)